MTDTVKFLSIVTAIRLKELREEAGLSHEKLSKRLMEELGIEISKSCLMKYEVAEAFHQSFGANMGMRTEYLYAFSSFYGVSTNYILGLSPIRSPSMDVNTAIQTTGLREQSVLLLRKIRRYFESEKQEGIHKPYYLYDNTAAATINLIDDFIEYALTVEKETYQHILDYIFFRQAQKEHNKYVAEIGAATPDEARERYEENLSWEVCALARGQTVLFADDTAKYSARSITDDFLAFLLNKYPLDPYPRKEIPTPTYMPDLSADDADNVK